MDVHALLSDLTAHFENAKADAERFLGEHLPALASVGEQATGNPAVVSLLAARHLSPEFLASLATVIDKTEADLAAAEEARAAAEAAQAAVAAAAAAPAPGEPQEPAEAV